MASTFLAIWPRTFFSHSRSDTKHRTKDCLIKTYMKCRGVMYPGNFAYKSDKSCFAFLCSDKA